MYAGPLASVIFHKRFPNQKQGEKKKYSHCEINPVSQTQSDQDNFGHKNLSVSRFAALFKTFLHLPRSLYDLPTILRHRT